MMVLAELPEGKSIRATVDGSEVLLYRTGGRILAVSNRCTHQGAPLHRGVVRESGSLLTVTCPLHSSSPTGGSCEGRPPSASRSSSPG